MAPMRVRERARAWFDSTMDRGTPALIGWLGLACLVLITVTTVLLMLLSPEGHKGGWAKTLWMALLRAMDPGTIGGDAGGVQFLGLMLFVTIGGIFLVSALVGVLTTGLDTRIGELRKGRSRVVTRDHMVILGWSDQVFVVVGELVKAAHGRRSTIVVLADHDKVEMADLIRDRVGDLGRTRVVCRTGSPLVRADLELVSPDTARSLLVVSPHGDDADIDVIKALLLLNNREWHTARRPHVVAAVHDSHNLAAARLAGGPHALIIDADDIAVRLVVHSHRQSGMSTVCSDLLDFSGNEIYMRPEPALVGRTYREALHAYRRGRPIGLLHLVDGERVNLNPPSDTPISATDQVLLVAEDELLIDLADAPAPVVNEAIVAVTERPHRADRTLLIGWNARAPKVVALLDRLVAEGSMVDIAAPTQPLGLPVTKNLTVAFRPADPTSRPALESLDVGSYQHVVVLSDDRMPPDRADDRTLVTLLHLRDIEVRLGDPFSIVTEMNDDANREIAQVTKADDVIVSSKMISLLLAQLAENRHLQGVFAELFDPAGAELYLKPITEYVRPDTPVTFATVVEAARRRGETAIGHRRHAESAKAPSYGVILNPDPAATLTYDARDAVIVVADS